MTLKTLPPGGSRLHCRAMLLAVALIALLWRQAPAQINPTRFDPRQSRRVASMAADRVQAIQFSPDEELLVAGSHDDGFRSYSTHNWQLLRNLKAGHGMTDCFVFSLQRDPRIAASAGNASVKIWDFNPGRALFDLKGHNSLVFAIAFSPDGKLLASAAQRTNANGYATSEVIFWSVANGQPLKTIDRPTAGTISSIAFSPDGRLLACAGGNGDMDKNGEISLWDTATGKEFATLEAPQGEIRKVVFSPDGRSLAVAVDQVVRGASAVYDLATGRERFRANDLPCAALDIAFSPDGRLLAVAIGDVRWRSLVAIIRGRNPDQLEGAEATFRPGDISFFDGHTGEPLGVLPHNTPLNRLCFSPKGKYLATAGYDINSDFTRDHTLAVWDLYPGK